MSTGTSAVRTPTKRASAGPSVAPNEGSAGERAYVTVKRNILTGAYQGGDLITEGHVADEVGISRTPVREAFLRLQAEGLLRLYPKRGALVVPVSAHEIDDLVEARVVLERFAAAAVIGRETHRQVAEQMMAVLDKQRTRVRRGDANGFTDLDRDFHAVLVDAAGNRIISALYASLRDRQVRMGIGALLKAPGRFEEILAEHEQLCRLLADGDGPGVAALLGGHITATGEALRGLRV
ncbi:MAG: GntR family transcriptional regulator [Pseudonocardiales bacterium]|nr:GntR family transcriptional regulator [Pseudonocardiales bacterium]